jgi:hypothetical protein
MQRHSKFQNEEGEPDYQGKRRGELGSIPSGLGRVSAIGYKVRGFDNVER